MTSFELEHPIARDLSRVQEALLFGFMDDFAWQAELDGLETQFLPSDQVEDGRSVLMVRDEHVGRAYDFVFAPPPDLANPMTVECVDEDEKLVTPVMARCFVQVTKPPLIKLGMRDGLPLLTNSIQVDITNEAAILVPAESTKVAPIFGEFDGSHYRFISAKLHSDMRLGMVLGLANIYLGD